MQSINEMKQQSNKLYTNVEMLVIHIQTMIRNANMIQQHSIEVYIPENDANAVMEQFLLAGYTVKHCDYFFDPNGRELITISW